MLHHRLLTYLDEVARCGTMRAAARKLNVASSAINRQILALEEELGTPIFERLTRRLRLTAAGEVLLEHVRETLRSHERMQVRINDLSGMRWGRVLVATQSTIAAEVMPSVISAFRSQHARCTVDVHMVENVLAHVQNDEVDIGIGFNLPTAAGIELVFECPVSLGVVMPPDHPLAGHATLTLAACAGYPLILPSPAMSMRPTLDQAFDPFAASLQSTVESNSVELMKTAAQMGQGLAFLTALNVAAERKRGQLIYVPLRETTMKPLHLRGICKKRRQTGALTRPFIRQCEQTVSALLASVET